MYVYVYIYHMYMCEGVGGNGCGPSCPLKRPQARWPRWAPGTPSSSVGVLAWGGCQEYAITSLSYAITSLLACQEYAITSLLARRASGACCLASLALASYAVSLSRSFVLALSRDRRAWLLRAPGTPSSGVRPWAWASTISQPDRGTQT